MEVTNEQLSILQALIWSPRPFQLVYMTGDSEMFRALDRLQIKEEGDKGNKWVVKHVLLPSQHTTEEA